MGKFWHMKTYNASDTIKKVSFLLETKEKFAFVTYTRSAIFSAIGEVKGEKKPPKNFTKHILNGLQMQSDNFVCAIQTDLVNSSLNKFKELNIDTDYFYDPSFLEYYINNNYDVFKTFTSWYLKHTKSVVVSFQNEMYINKYFCSDSTFIQVPYNDFYSKVDLITKEIVSKTNKADLLIFDCPMLSSAIAPKIWAETDMSIFDLGRTLNAARSLLKTNDSKK
jgi:hypothetical protein